MRIVFMGTPQFAVPSLAALVEGGEDIRAVFTQPDRPAGRGQKTCESAVKKYALSNGLNVFQPERMRRPEAMDQLASFEPDLLVVVAYGQLLPQKVLDIPAVAPINVHASLLPLYRGAAPIQWAVVNGESETGITVMRISLKMDSGDIILARSEPIRPEDTAGSLHDRLSQLGADCLLEAVDQIRRGTASFTPQNHAAATFAPMLEKDSARIQWSRTVTELYDFIRGMNPWPMAFTLYRGEPCKILCARIREAAGFRPADHSRPGRLFCRCRQLLVETGDGGLLEIERLQLPCRPAISGADFINGCRPGEEERFV